MIQEYTGVEVTVIVEYWQSFTKLRLKSTTAQESPSRQPYSLN